MIASKHAATIAGSVLELFRAARAKSDGEFVKATFDWLRQFLVFDVLLLARAPLSQISLAHAHLHGIADPEAALESYAAVAHLDIFAVRVIERMGTPVRMDWDAPEVAGTSHDAYRAHLRRHRLVHGAAVGQLGDDENVHVFSTIRSTEGDHLSDQDLEIVRELAPYVVEAMIFRWTAAWLSSDDLKLVDLPVALVDERGSFKHMTDAFARHYQPEANRRGYLRLERACLEAIAEGRSYPLGHGHCLYGIRDGADWLVRVRPESRRDLLAPRELEVALAYASGTSYTKVARDLGIAPATVRRHIANIYAKLGVTHRVELLQALTGDTTTPKS